MSSGWRPSGWRSQRLADQRLAALRRLMEKGGYRALLVPRADEYLGEYLPPHHERLRWLTGFTGSAGLAVILPEKAALFVDGRYTVQVRHQVSADLFEILHLVDEPPVAWLASQLAAGDRVAADPRLHSARWYREATATLAAAGAELIAVAENPVDCCWLDRPQALRRPAVLLSEDLTGESSLEKRRRIAAAVAAKGADAALVFPPDSISWLLNVRGTDVPRMPVLQSMAVLEGDGRLSLLVDGRRIPDGFEAHVGPGVNLFEPAEAAAVLAGLSGKAVLVDQGACNAWCEQALEAAGCRQVAGEDPVLLPKACKNPIELAGTRAAHIRDGAAKTRFLAWLDAEVAANRLHDEAALAEALYVIRREDDQFRDLSFDTISAAGPNAAMCHYNHRDGDPARLTMNSVYLVDSGAHYLDGTTDITRTVAIGDPGPEVRRMFTLVLKGHIALARARFPTGTTGSQLDVLARQFLWHEGCDYDHGTGHGVGVFLNVHEGPQRISKVHNGVALRPGMIISNEPGYYRDDAFGIRCENLVVVREIESGQGETPMLGFETITLAPFDRRLLDLALLGPSEQGWLDAYHRRVADTIGPLLDADSRAWLDQATRPLATI